MNENSRFAPLFSNKLEYCFVKSLVKSRPMITLFINRFFCRKWVEVWSTDSCEPINGFNNNYILWLIHLSIWIDSCVHDAGVKEKLQEQTTMKLRR